MVKDLSNKRLQCGENTTMYKNAYNAFEIKLKSRTNHSLFTAPIELKKLCMSNSTDGVYRDLRPCRDCPYVDNVIVNEVNIPKKKAS